MIIQSIHASNVLKYTNLELENIPEKGKIAISGANESGKTAIVETISFALFGRTFSNDLANITRTIRWGETSCSVTMNFTAAGNSYTLTRSVDKTGMHSAEIFLAGEDTPFATGPQAVQEEAIKVCGFDFEQYIDSLYLAQMEITSSASQAETIKGIAGANPIESIISDLKDEISAENDNIAAIEFEQERIRKQIGSLDIQENRTAAIETEKQQLTNQIDLHKEEINNIQTTSNNIRDSGTHVQESGHSLTAAGQDISVKQWRAHLDSIADSVENMRESVNTLEMETELRSGGGIKKYAEQLKADLSAFDSIEEKSVEYRSQLASQLGERGNVSDDGSLPLPKQQSRMKARLFSQRLYRNTLQALLAIAILASLLSWAGWWLLGQFPDSSLAGVVSGWFSQPTSGWNAENLSTLRNLAIALSVSAVLVFFLMTRVISRINKGSTELLTINERLDVVRQQAELLDNITNKPLPEIVKGVDALDNKPLKESLLNFIDNKGASFVSEHSFADHQKRLNALLDENASHVASLRETIASQVGKLNHLNDEELEKINRLERELQVIHANQKEAADLETIINNMQPSLDEHKESIQVREMALSLALGACRNIYNHFNQVLSKYTAIVMPKLTEGRYKQIQIDDNLKVRVFATEKNDFADLDELSSGTQRQIMLAVRLAISKALVEAGQLGKQFIILDEPFAFFDRERIRNTIKSLNDLDKNISQFWVLTQEFESTDDFELSIECTRDTDELTLA
jgi:DNA repair exonuclease SbcCD ATPase subunit